MRVRLLVQRGSFDVTPEGRAWHALAGRQRGMGLDAGGKAAGEAHDAVNAEGRLMDVRVLAPACVRPRPWNSISY